MSNAIANIKSFDNLPKGWDGYSAAPTSDIARIEATAFIEALHAGSLDTTRVAPSVVGGIGITLKRSGRKAYVEFYNDGAIYAMFVARGQEPVTEPIRHQRSAYDQLVAQIHHHLYA